MSKGINKFSNENSVAKDTIYVCLNPDCGKREKEYSLKDRNQKICSSCGCNSIKSELLESYVGYLSGQFTPTFEQGEE